MNFIKLTSEEVTSLKMVKEQLSFISILWIIFLPEIFSQRVDKATASFINEGPITVGYASWAVITLCTFKSHVIS